MNEIVLYKARRISLNVVMTAPKQYAWRYQIDEGAIHPCLDRPLSTEVMARDEALTNAKWTIDQSQVSLGDPYTTVSSQLWVDFGMVTARDPQAVYRDAYERSMDAICQLHAIVECATSSKQISDRATVLAALHRVQSTHLEWMEASRPFLNLD